MLQRRPDRGLRLSFSCARGQRSGVLGCASCSPAAWARSWRGARQWRVVEAVVERFRHPAGSMGGRMENAGAGASDAFAVGVAVALGGQATERNASSSYPGGTWPRSHRPERRPEGNSAQLVVAASRGRGRESTDDPHASGWNNAR